MSVTFLKRKGNAGSPSGEISTAKPLSANTPAAWIAFVECLLAGTVNCIELRAIKPSGGAADVCLWTRDTGAIADYCNKHNGVNHVLVGAATRIQGGGKKEHCREALWVWADVDFKDFAGGEAEARERLQKFEFQPSAVVHTGGGLHLYWLLNVTIDLTKSGKRFEEALRRITKKIGGDKSRAEMASVMRMSGTINMKPERHRAVAKVEFFDPSIRYDLDVFLAGPSPSSACTVSGASLHELGAAIVKGNRDAGAFRYVNATIKRNGSANNDTKLTVEVTELLVKAGGDGLDAIIAKIPGWIASAHALFDHAKKPTPLALADAIKEVYGSQVACVGGQLRIYRDGYWPLADELVLRNQIAELSRPYTGPNLTTQSLQNLKDLTVVRKFASRTDLICLNNGTLNPETEELLPHDASHYLVNTLDIAWDPQAGSPLWLKTLDEVFAGDPDVAGKILLLQKWFGYCLVADTRYHKFLWLVGAGANGKSLVLMVLEAVVGSHNCTHLMLNRISRDFVRASLQDKLVNISSEMRSEDTVPDSLLKAIAAGDTIEAEIKYGPSISFRPTARLVAATNELPRLLDTSEGFRRRVMIIRFPRVFAEHEQDRDRFDHLLGELPGIFRWAVEGLKKLREEGQFTTPASSAAAVEEYMRDADPVRQFVEQLLLEDLKGGIHPKDLYTAYEEWSKQRGFKSMNIITFGKRLAALRVKSRLTNGKKIWCVRYNIAGFDPLPFMPKLPIRGVEVGEVEKVEMDSIDF